MTRIFRDQDMVTLINVFTVAPKDQQRLVDLLVEATKEVISKQPGYVSAKHSQKPRRHAGHQLRAVA